VLKNLHSEFFDKAKEALYRQSTEEREFSSITFSCSNENLQEAKLALRTLQVEFAQKFQSKSKNRNAVFQLSTQLFRLDKKIQGEQI
jgi:uncharacterized protein (TIGR02147 family)